jgi:hypothetical protein
MAPTSPPPRPLTTSTWSARLPLLADLFTDLWERMRERGDGTLRVSDRREIIQVGTALSKRARPRQLQVFPVCNGSCCNKCTMMARSVGLSPCELSSFFKAREKILFA